MNNDIIFLINRLSTEAQNYALIEPNNHKHAKLITKALIAIIYCCM